MPDKPAVVYAVTEKHMAQLSALSAGAVFAMDLGEAKFLEAICEAVWPGLRVRIVGTKQATFKGIPAQVCDVWGLHRYTVDVKAMALTERYRQRIEDRKAALMQAGRHLEALYQTQESDGSILQAYTRPQTAWAASADEAIRSVADYLDKRGIVAELAVKEGPSP